MNVSTLNEQEAAAQAAASGLVSLSTSDTFTGDIENEFNNGVRSRQLVEFLEGISIDPVKSRLSRLRKNVGVSARCFETMWDAPGKRKGRVIFITLTYAGTNDDWNPKHITGFIKCLRGWCNRRDIDCRYVWVAELQKRGVIHYHVAIWLPKQLTLPKPDKQGWWRFGMSNIAVARKPVAYLMKYLSKDTSKTFGAFPKGARIYGVGGLAEFVRVRRWLNYPHFIKCRADITERWRRVRGGGWSSPDGEIFESEYEYCKIAGKPHIRRVCEHEKLIEPAGAFCWIH